MKWLREAISDDKGLADMANIVLGLLAICAVVSLNFICLVAYFDWRHCIDAPITTIAKGDTSVTSVITCRFDPVPIGTAAGLIFGAFATLIGALGGYIRLTRKKAGDE